MCQRYPWRRGGYGYRVSGRGDQAYKYYGVSCGDKLASMRNGLYGCASRSTIGGDICLVDPEHAQFVPFIDIILPTKVYICTFPLHPQPPFYFTPSLLFLSTQSISRKSHRGWQESIPGIMFLEKMLTKRLLFFPSTPPRIVDRLT